MVFQIQAGWVAVAAVKLAVAAVLDYYYLGCFHASGCPKNSDMQFDIPRNCYQCGCVILCFLAFDSLRERRPV